jgi:penicillin G amidase
MKILRTILLVLLLVIVLVAVGGVVLFNDLTRGPLPQISGDLRVEGLQDTVEIKRDEWGVPYIYASNMHDLFFAQGYTQAQDRWWQMEFFRATGDGRIQELTGENDDLMGTDIFIRTIGWRRAAERDVAEKYDEETLTLLQAFADGVNAYLRGKSGGDLSLDYSLLGVNGVNIPIREWTVVDSVVWQKVMSWDLSNRMGDIRRAENLETVGEDLYAAYEPAYPFDRMQTIVTRDVLPLTEESLGGSASLPLENIAVVSTALAGNIQPGTRFAFGQGDGLGSNNWVVSGAMTESGKPLLANDPHLGVRMPSIWYEIGLFCRPVSAECPYNARGFTFAPFPGIVIGHNDRVAWGFTNVGPDVMDVYKIKVNPEDPTQYEWDSQWRDMTIHQETIRFGDSDKTITVAVRETHLGPIINDNELDENGQPTGFNNEDPMVLRWTALDPSQTITAIFRLNTAQNWETFRAAASLFDAPSQNLVYADVDGNIGYQTPGLIPVRPAGVSGLLPVEATDDSALWLGYIPFDLLPRVYNPESGYIHSANEALVPPEYYDWLAEQLADEYGADANYTISTDWDPGYRGMRIVELLETGAPFNVGKFEQIQGDNKFIPAEITAPYLEALVFNDAALTEARDWLLGWDYQMHMDSPQAALFGQFWAQLQKSLYQDQLEGGSDLLATVLLLEEPENAWWDDTATADVVETRDDILKRAFESGYQATVAALGADRAQWKWGDLHTTTFVNNPLGLSGIDLVEDIFNRGPVATSGSFSTVNAASWDASEGDFTVGSGASFRMIVDLGDLDNSVNMHTTGQSSHPYSPYYDNMIDSWRRVQYKPMLFTEARISETAANTLMLRPR